MAKRKKSRTYRRRRVSGIGKSDQIQTLLGGVIGYVVGNAVAKKLTGVDDKIKAAILIAVPIFFGKQLKSALLKGAGIGLGITGVKTAGAAFNIPLISGVPVVAGYRRMNGYNVPVVAGSADNPSLRVPNFGNNSGNGAVVNGIPGNVSNEMYASTRDTETDSDFTDTDRRDY